MQCTTRWMGLLLHFTNSGNPILPSLQSLQKHCQYWELGCWNHGLFNHDSALFTPNQNSPSPYPHLRPLFHCQLPSGLQSHRQFPISYPWPMVQKTQAHSHVGVPREPCFSTCQLTRPGNTAGNREQSECTGWKECQGLMGADSMKVHLLISLTLLILLSTALVPICFEPPHGHLGNLWGPPWKWEAGGKQRWLGL